MFILQLKYNSGKSQNLQKIINLFCVCLQSTLDTDEISSSQPLKKKIKKNKHELIKIRKIK